MTGRVVLTRDKRLAARKDATMCYFIKDDDAKKGFQEVVHSFGLSFNPLAFLARYLGWSLVGDVLLFCLYLFREKTFYSRKLTEQSLDPRKLTEQ
jgi:hypothetical protein